MCLAVPGRVVEISDRQEQRVLVDLEGVRRQVSSALLSSTGADAIEIDDWVLVHVGFALAKIDEEEAQATLDLLRQMGEAYEDELQQLASEA